MSKLFTNKEVVTFFVVLLIISGFFFIGILLFESYSTQLFVGYVVVVFILFYSIHAYRYRKLNQLNQYFKEINSKTAIIAFDDLLEGELSLLKSELYKVTVMIHNQNQALNFEKERMAQSLADISHQIKTPLTSISMMMDLLNDEELTTQQQHSFIHQATQQLQRIKFLINALLKMASLQSGNFTMSKKQHSVDTLIDQSKDSLDVLLDLYQVTLSINKECQSILCDLIWTQEALNNVLKNAIEHSYPNQEVLLRIKKDTIGYKILISNVGKTIQKEQQKRVFDRFYKSSESRVDSIGIGLALAKEIVEKQHGFIDVSSENETTTFTITLPFS